MGTLYRRRKPPDVLYRRGTFARWLLRAEIEFDDVRVTSPKHDCPTAVRP